MDILAADGIKREADGMADEQATDMPLQWEDEWTLEDSPEEFSHASSNDSSFASNESPVRLFDPNPPDFGLRENGTVYPPDVYVRDDDATHVDVRHTPDGGPGGVDLDFGGAEYGDESFDEPLDLTWDMSGDW